MNIYSISDLHLAISVPEKSMEMFGSSWANYMQKIETGWREVCKEEDIIVIPGDISWAMRVSEMKEDLEFIEKLPGTKLLLKGNHDYWWETLSKLEKYKQVFGLKSIFFMHNNSYIAGERAICGTRGWLNPEDKKFTPEDGKIYAREQIRLELSLKDAVSKDVQKIIAVFHFPPFSLSGSDTNGFIDILRKYNVQKCLFGHIHSLNKQFELWKKRAETLSRKTGIDFRVVSADFLDFRPVCL